MTSNCQKFKTRSLSEFIFTLFLYFFFGVSKILTWVYSIFFFSQYPKVVIKRKKTFWAFWLAKTDHCQFIKTAYKNSRTCSICLIKARVRLIVHDATWQNSNNFDLLSNYRKFQWTFIRVFGLTITPISYLETVSGLFLFFFG